MRLNWRYLRSIYITNAEYWLILAILTSYFTLTYPQLGCFLISLGWYSLDLVWHVQKSRIYGSKLLLVLTTIPYSIYLARIVFD